MLRAALWPFYRLLAAFSHAFLHPQDRKRLGHGLGVIEFWRGNHPVVPLETRIVRAHGCFLLIHVVLMLVSHTSSPVEHGMADGVLPFVLAYALACSWPSGRRL